MVTIDTLSNAVPEATVYGLRSQEVERIVDIGAHQSEKELLFLGNPKLVDEALTIATKSRCPFFKAISSTPITSKRSNSSQFTRPLRWLSRIPMTAS